MLLELQSTTECKNGQARVHAFTISLDGYGAAPDQDIHNRLWVGGMALYEWMFSTRAWRRLHGKDSGTTGIDDDYLPHVTNCGARIVGRNMSGPVRGPWTTIRVITASPLFPCFTWPNRILN
jgi:hypothetical protein